MLFPGGAVLGGMLDLLTSCLRPSNQARSLGALRSERGVASSCPSAKAPGRPLSLQNKERSGQCLHTCPASSCENLLLQGRPQLEGIWSQTCSLSNFWTCLCPGTQFLVSPSIGDVESSGLATLFDDFTGSNSFIDYHILCQSHTRAIATRTHIFQVQFTLKLVF